MSVFIVTISTSLGWISCKWIYGSKYIYIYMYVCMYVLFEWKFWFYFNTTVKGQLLNNILESHLFLVPFLKVCVRLSSVIWAELRMKPNIKCLTCVVHGFMACNQIPPIIIWHMCVCVIMQRHTCAYTCTHEWTCMVEWFMYECEQE